MIPLASLSGVAETPSILPFSSTLTFSRVSSWVEPKQGPWHPTGLPMWDPAGRRTRGGEKAHILPVSVHILLVLLVLVLVQVCGLGG